MKFGIVIRFERRTIHLNIERVSHDSIKERFKVIAKNNVFTLENNRPLLMGKNLKHKPINWKIVEGGYTRAFIVDLITKEIEKSLTGFA